MGQSQVWIELECLKHASGGTIKVLDLAQVNSVVVVQLGDRRIELERLAVMERSSLQIVPIVQGIAKVAVSLDVVGVETKGLSEGSNRPDRVLPVLED